MIPNLLRLKANDDKAEMQPKVAYAMYKAVK